MGRREERDSRHRRAVGGRTGQGLIAGPDLGGVGDGAAEALREARDDAAGEARGLRAQDGRGSGNLVGAKGRGHRQHCQNLS